MTDLWAISCGALVVGFGLLTWSIRRSARNVAAREAQLADLGELVRLLKAVYRAAQEAIPAMQPTKPSPGGETTSALRAHLVAAVADVETYEIRHRLRESNGPKSLAERDLPDGR